MGESLGMDGGKEECAYTTCSTHTIHCNDRGYTTWSTYTIHCNDRGVHHLVNPHHTL